MRERLYKKFVYPEVISRFDPERVHDMTVHALSQLQKFSLGLRVVEGLGFKRKRFEDKRLNTKVNGVDLENPILLAAGFDKNASCFASMHALGFSSVVVGTVVEHPQKGNKKPRIFRAGNSLVNSMGFPSSGAEEVLNNLKKHKRPPVGVSLGLNKNTAPEESFEKYTLLAEFFDKHADYFEINVSSPNTPGLMDLQGGKYLEQIVESIVEVTNKPLFVKISPDLSFEEIDDIIRVVVDHDIGIVATNTTTSREVKKSLGEKWTNVPGGVSGEALQDRSKKVVNHIFKNSDVDIVGVGGVKDLESVLQMISSGARAVQIFTGFVVKGPSLPGRLNFELYSWMKGQGVDSIEEIRGQKL